MFSKKLKKDFLAGAKHVKNVPVQNYKEILLNNKPTVPVLFAPPVYCCSEYIGPGGPTPFLILIWVRGSP